MKEGPSSSEENKADPGFKPQETQKQQGADRPTTTPSNEEHERIAATKAEADEAAKVDTSAPGTKSLEEKARDLSKEKVHRGEEVQKESQGEGTGMLYVKSSGMNAEGGDFDASKPGAGREADREFSFFEWGRGRS